MEPAALGFGLDLLLGLTLNSQALLTPDLYLDIAPSLNSPPTGYNTSSSEGRRLLDLELGVASELPATDSTLAATVAWATVVLAISYLLGLHPRISQRQTERTPLCGRMGGWPWYPLVTPSRGLPPSGP